MNLIIKANEKILVEAHAKALAVLRKDIFWEAIRTKQKFDLTKSTPEEIAEFLKNTNHSIKIISWKPNWFQSIGKYKKTLAITGSKDIIRLNVRKIDRPIHHIAGTMIHEGVHAVDYSFPDKKFGHGDNSSVNKDDTAPYWIGNLAISILNDTYSPNVKIENVLQSEET